MSISSVLESTKEEKKNAPKHYEFEEALKASTKYFAGSEMSASVFLNKYALRDNDQNLLELTPTDMHRREAREFARIEAKKFKNPLTEEEIFGYLDQFAKIIPQGSPMYGIGNKYQTISLANCFVAGTKVTTSNGVKNIEDVKIGDRVPTHRGRFNAVTQIHRNDRDGRLLYDVKSFRTPRFCVTGNHAFWSISKEQLKWGESPQWNKIEYLRDGDYIAIPHVSQDDNVEDIDLDQIFPDGDHQYGTTNYLVEKTDDSIILTTTWYSGNKMCHKRHFPTNRKWAVDSDFAYFLGLWYGDGCVFGENSSETVGRRNRNSKIRTKVRGITFTFNSKEVENIAFVSKYGEQLFGLRADVNDNSEMDGTTQIAFHSSAVGMAFEQLFGSRFDGKKLYAKAFVWPSILADRLLQGVVDSDGCITSTGELRVVLANKQLVESLYHLGRLNGHVVGRCEGQRYSRLDFGTTSVFASKSKRVYSDNRIAAVAVAVAHQESKFGVITIDSTKFVRIEKKTRSQRTDATVYTIGVETDHSYVVEGVICQNCFVVAPPLDSYGDIIRTDEELVQISKRRGGNGTDVANLRPAGAITHNAARTSTGTIPFCTRFSNSIREVGQSGRRGALMITQDIHHPESVIPWDEKEDGEPFMVHIKDKDLGEFDISSKYFNPKKLDFCTMKYDRTKVTGANISLRLSDEFLSAVEKDESYQQRWPVTQKKNPKVEKLVKSSDVWDKIMYSAWRCAEPGILFWDTIIRESIADCYAKFGFKTESTNPCGEINLSANDSCRLLVLNLFGFVKNPYTKNAYFDYIEFYKTSQVAQRLMDDLVDLEVECILKIIAKIDSDPEPENVKDRERALWNKILNVCKNGRRTGTGVVALGDALAAINVGYGTEEGISTVDKIYKTLKHGAYRASVDMAKEIGAFPVWDHDLEKENPYLNRIRQESFIIEGAPGDFMEIRGQELWDDMKCYGRRNIALLTTAPTGTVSMVTKLMKRFYSSGGIEPQYEAEYIRKIKGNPGDRNFRSDSVDQNGDHWQHFPIRCAGLEEWMEVNGETDWTKSPYYGNCAAQLDWSIRVRLQATAQKHVDHSISSTVNLPSAATVEDVKKIYETAWKAGCKGITVYRDGCRTGVLVKAENVGAQIPKTNAPSRPIELPGDVHHVKVKGNDYFVIVGKYGNGQEPYEVFAGVNGFIGKGVKTCTIKKISRGRYQAECDDGSKIESITDNITEDQAAVTRMISVSLRHGADIQFIVHQLEKVRGDMTCFSKAMSRALKKYIADGTVVHGEVCEKCSGQIVRADGCRMCRSCGDSRCS